VPAKEDGMEFLVEFEVEVPDGTPEREVERRTAAEASAAARLAEEGIYFDFGTGLRSRTTRR
jgi:muconolactone delta-isomerase